MVTTLAREILERRRTELESLLHERLRHSSAAHYRSVDPQLLGVRLRDLLDAFLDALGEHPFGFGQYLRRIAEDRFDEGVDLTEIQLVLNLLGEHAWCTLCAEIDDRDALLEALGRSSAVIGHAKDALAQVYLERSRRARHSLERLRDCLEHLMSGTDSAMPVD